MYESWNAAAAKILDEPYKQFDVEKEHISSIVNRIPFYFNYDEE